MTVYDSTGRGGHFTDSQPASLFFRKIMQNFAEFLANFEKIVQKIVNYSNCLQFPEIPAKFREIFTEKIAISVDFRKFFEKICKNHENLRKSENFEM